MNPTGGCYCGRVRFEVALPSLWVAHCHCMNCRAAHAAAFVTWAGFAADQFAWTEGVEQLTRFHTPTDATRTFCRVCGTTLTFESPRWKGEVHVAYACFDGVHDGEVGQGGHDEGPLDKRPMVHAYADRAVSWCALSDELPRFGGDSGSEPLDDKARAIQAQVTSNDDA